MKEGEGELRAAEVSMVDGKRSFGVRPMESVEAKSDAKASKVPKGSKPQ